MLNAGIFGSARVGSVAPTYRSQVLADSPYCYYPLDDATTPTDVMGNTTPDLVAGVTLGVTGIGDGATAAAFDGGALARGVRIPTAQLPAIGSLTAMTVEVIAQATNMTSARAMFARENMIILRHGGTALLEAYTGSTWANQIGTGTAEPTPTARHHYAITWDGANAVLYRDGVAFITEAQTASMSSAAQNMHIGSRSSTNVTFLGTLAGFAFYTTALSPARILAHAQAAGVA